MKRIVAISVLSLVGTLTFTACLRTAYEAPPDLSGYDPGLPVTSTIARLKAMNGSYISTVSFDTTLITEDVTIAGIVTADDRSGNYYKQIVLQDSTGGIALNIDAYSLYNDYPVGRKIYVKCKGLYLGYDGGLPELGGSLSEQLSVNGISGNSIADHIVKADIGHTVKDTVITLAQAKLANPFFYNRLVTISDVEFLDPGKTYTEPTATTNRFMVNCASESTVNQLATRNSNYANFHAFKMPAGHGSITGIFTVYQTSATSKTAQIVIRDTTDVQLGASRCDVYNNSIFLQTFDSSTSGDIALQGWTNYDETGGVKWQAGTAGTVTNKPYAQVTAYNTGKTSIVSWLVTPGIDLTGTTDPKLTFINADGRDNGAVLKVMVSTNYVPGSTPSMANWVPLKPVISNGHTTTYGSFISSGKLSLKAYIGQTICIAFKYIGTDPATGTKNTTTFEIDNVNVTAD